jgi:pimeloyl-ACP methyl ester carboxylesterase
MPRNVVATPEVLSRTTPAAPQVRNLISPFGVRIGHEVYGNGPPLVLIHGAFSDHRSNWAYVRPLLEPHFTVFAVARRGRGRTDATSGHSLEDECGDVAELLRRIGAPAALLGHSYGALVALGAALQTPGLVRRLVLYEAPWPHLLDDTALAPLEALARAGDWDGFARTFFADILAVPRDVLDDLRASPDWAAIVADAPASLGDLRALARHRFDPERFSTLTMPVLLQTGTESPPDFYVTDALAAVLADATIGPLEGQAHEGMTTAPEQYVEAVRRFVSR